MARATLAASMPSEVIRALADLPPEGLQNLYRDAQRTVQLEHCERLGVQDAARKYVSAEKATKRAHDAWKAAKAAEVEAREALRTACKTASAESIRLGAIVAAASPVAEYQIRYMLSPRYRGRGTERE